MNTGSVWSQTAELPPFAPLAGDRKTDVLVIGGGIAGILCTYRLRRAGVDCLLLEADRLCGGITKNTTAKITVQHGMMYDKLIRHAGYDTAAKYLAAQKEAAEEYRALCRGIDCDYEELPSVVYTRKDPRAVERETDALLRLGCPAEYKDSLPLPFSVAGAVSVPRQAQFHPLRFLSAIVRDLPVCEHTKVTELMPGAAVTPHGTVRAQKIVVCTHFPILNKHGFYFLKMYQHRSYVLALQDAPPLSAMYIDEDSRGLSLRPWRDLLLLGGGSHRTGKPGGGWRELTEVTRDVFPDATVAARWATQDCMTLDGLPYIGRYSSRVQDLFVATGFNKWGMTSAMAAASVLCDLVQGRKNGFASLFSPSRSVLHPQLAANTFEALRGWLTIGAPRCPHLGCALSYNAAEHTWDCACHGSRFAESGELIDNPATDDRQAPLSQKGRRPAAGAR